jgi:hypothetical protein
VIFAFVVMRCAEDLCGNVSNALDKAHNRQRQKTCDANESDQKEQEIGCLQRVFRRANDKSDSLNNKPKRNPAGHRTYEVKPKLVKLPGERLVGVINFKNVEGFETVEKAKCDRKQTERNGANVEADG